MKREYSIDLIRIVCCLIVVLGHCLLVSIHQSPVPVDPSFRSTVEQITVFLRWVIPAFLMITGYVIAKKKTCTYQYCFSHVLKFVEVLFTVGLFFALLELVFDEKTFSGSIVVRALVNVITGQLWDHMWYVYLIIGIYLILPVVHSFLQQDQRSVIILTVVLFVFSIMVPYLDKWIHIGVRVPFSEYLFYVVFGGAVSKIKTNKKWRCLYIFMTLLCMIYMVRFFRMENWETTVHPAVCLMAMSLFLLMKDCDIKPSKRLLALSGLTWGVYLIHPFFINVVVKVFRINLVGSMAWLKIAAFFCLMSAVSFGTTFILKKIPFVKDLF